ncbi:MAG: yqgN [Firmicutes bacterium]|nr:yqgN [Bacillota bacterium]
MDELQNEKKKLRRDILKIRRSLTYDRVEIESNAIISHLKCSELFENSRSIMCYLAMKDEVQTYEIVDYALRQGKSVCVPYIRDRVGIMDAVIIHDLNELVRGDLDILTVSKLNVNVVNIKEIDLIIMPGVAFDRYGHRLGMGAGFYDRFLEKADYAKLVGLAFSCQVLEDVPSMPHDYLVHYIVTKDGIINCKTGKM